MWGKQEDKISVRRWYKNNRNVSNQFGQKRMFCTCLILMTIVTIIIFPLKMILFILNKIHITNEKLQIFSTEVFTQNRTPVPSFNSSIS